MINVLTYIISFAVTYPLVITVICYFLSIRLLNNKWKAIHSTVNYTTVFYIGSVSTLLSVIFGKNFVGIIFILLVTILSMAVTYQWKTKGEIVFRHAWKAFWRVTFLLFLVSHIFLVLLGIGLTIANI